MDSAKAEQVILGRFKERCHTAGAIQAGYGMRAQAGLAEGQSGGHLVLPDGGRGGPGQGGLR